MNVLPEYVKPSVTEFRRTTKDKTKLVGGLLDYGYSLYQISDMTSMTPQEVFAIKTEQGFKDAEEQYPRNKQ